MILNLRIKMNLLLKIRVLIGIMLDAPGTNEQHLKFTNNNKIEIDHVWKTPYKTLICDASI